MSDAVNVRKFNSLIGWQVYLNAVDALMNIDAQFSISKRNRPPSSRIAIPISMFVSVCDISDCILTGTYLRVRQDNWKRVTKEEVEAILLQAKVRGQRCCINNKGRWLRRLPSSENQLRQSMLDE